MALSMKSCHERVLSVSMRSLVLLSLGNLRATVFFGQGRIEVLDGCAQELPTYMPLYGFSKCFGHTARCLH